MTMRWMTMAVMIALGASAAASGQSKIDRAFRATGTSCDQITWSQETLAQYPNIESACQGVMQRDGKYYVKFEGEVRRVAERGQRLTIDFKSGDLLTLTPPENMSLYINGQPTPVEQLRPGDQLNFYVPEDRLTAEFFESDAATSTAQEVPMAAAPPARVAEAPPAPSESAELPKTASVLPLFGLAGVLLVSFGAALTVKRRVKRRI